jgi:hypothetical protein
MMKSLKKGIKVLWGKRYRPSEEGILLCTVELDKDKDYATQYNSVGIPVQTSYGKMYAHWVEEFKEMEKDLISEDLN